MDTQKTYTCEDVAKMAGVSAQAARVYAYANDIPYTGEGRRKTYTWRQSDIDKFLERPSPGRPAKNE